MSAKPVPSQTDLFLADAPQGEVLPGDAAAVPRGPASRVPRRPANAVAAPKPAVASLSVALRDPGPIDGAAERYLSDNEVAKRFGVSRPTVWRWCKTSPDFPPPKVISPGTTRWALSDLLRFEAGLPVKGMAKAGALGNTVPGGRE